MRYFFFFLKEENLIENSIKFKFEIFHQRENFSFSFFGYWKKSYSINQISPLIFSSALSAGTRATSHSIIAPLKVSSIAAHCRASALILNLLFTGVHEFPIFFSTFHAGFVNVTRKNVFFFFFFLRNYLLICARHELE